MSRPPVPEEVFDYPGRWVAILDDVVIADADTLEELQTNSDVTPSASLFRVSEPQSSFF